VDSFRRVFSFVGDQARPLARVLALASALPTSAAPPQSVEPKISVFQRVATLAMTPTVKPARPAFVLGIGAWLKMVGIDTHRDSAEMVERQSVLDLAFQ